MTEKLPEFRYLPGGLLLDGELVAWKKGVPHFPLLTRRILNGDRSVAVTFMAFDLLELDGQNLLATPLAARRTLLESLDLNTSYWITPETFADGPELYQAVCEHGLEGIVAKELASAYRPGQRDGSRSRTRAIGGATRSSRRFAGRTSVAWPRKASSLQEGMYVHGCDLVSRLVSAYAQGWMALRPWGRDRGSSR
jgi:hypothetical protein